MKVYTFIPVLITMAVMTGCATTVPHCEDVFKTKYVGYPTYKAMAFPREPKINSDVQCSSTINATTQTEANSGALENCKKTNAARGGETCELYAIGSERTEFGESVGRKADNIDTANAAILGVQTAVAFDGIINGGGAGSNGIAGAGGKTCDGIQQKYLPLIKGTTQDFCHGHSVLFDFYSDMQRAGCGNFTKEINNSRNGYESSCNSGNKARY